MDEYTGEVILQVVDPVDGEVPLSASAFSPHCSPHCSPEGRLKSAKEQTSPAFILPQGTEDVLLISATCYHIIRPISAARGMYALCFMVTLERDRAILPMARHTIAQIEKGIVLSAEELSALKAMRRKPYYA